jgi:1-aminocyclopropane-1-carboxylate deaminase/D-cysteine desulfhydrase-like pyridoxal-dependent ACC family enzyme
MDHAAAALRPLALRLPSPLEELPDDRLTRAGVCLYLKRDDVISPDIPGNKWRKLKDGDVRSLQRAAFGAVSGNWSIEHDFHFGGFARRKPVLDEFIADFEKRHVLALDRVYTAKMMYGLFALAQRGAFRPGTVAVALITG